MPELTYKLPQPFLDAIGDALTLVDWTAQQTAKVELPDGAPVLLEAIKGRYGATVVRPGNAGSAIKIRRFADQLAAAQPDKYPKQDPAEVERVIRMRNPAPDRQD